MTDKNIKFCGRVKSGELMNLLFFIFYFIKNKTNTFKFYIYYKNIINLSLLFILK